MALCMQLVLSVGVYSTVISVALGQERPAKPTAQVEFRWVECKPINGVTEEKGIRTSCGNTLSFLHTKPILTNVNVAETRLSKHDLSGIGFPGEHFMIAFYLKKQAKQKLIAACGDHPTRLLAILIDGKYRGAANFQKSKVADFVPYAGYISSRADAERIVKAFK